MRIEDKFLRGVAMRNWPAWREIAYGGSDQRDTSGQILERSWRTAYLVALLIILGVIPGG